MAWSPAWAPDQQLQRCKLRRKPAEVYETLLRFSHRLQKTIPRIAVLARQTAFRDANLTRISESDIRRRPVRAILLI
jgi:hypothetical protein